MYTYSVITANNNAKINDFYVGPPISYYKAHGPFLKSHVISILISISTIVERRCELLPSV